MRDLESLTYLPGTREASTGLDKTIGRSKMKVGQNTAQSMVWEKSLPQDLTANPKRGDPLVY